MIITITITIPIPIVSINSILVTSHRGLIRYVQAQAMITKADLSDSAVLVWSVTLYAVLQLQLDGLKTKKSG